MPTQQNLPNRWARGQRAHGHALGVDRLASAFRGGAEVGNKAPTRRMRQLARAVVAQDYQQLLVRRAVPTRRVVVAAALAHVQAIDDGKPYWSATSGITLPHTRVM